MRTRDCIAWRLQAIAKWTVGNNEAICPAVAGSHTIIMITSGSLSLGDEEAIYGGYRATVVMHSADVMDVCTWPPQSIY